MGKQRTFSVFPSTIFPTPEHCRNALENLEGKMDKTARLHKYRYALLCHKQGIGGHRKWTAYQLCETCCLILIIYLTIFFLDKFIYDNHPWQTIVDNNEILARYDILAKYYFDNFSSRNPITYPPTEYMSGTVVRKFH